MFIFLNELSNLVISWILFSLVSSILQFKEFLWVPFPSSPLIFFALDHVFHYKYNILTFFFEFFFNSIISWVQRLVLHSVITYLGVCWSIFFYCLPWILIAAHPFVTFSVTHFSLITLFFLHSLSDLRPRYHKTPAEDMHTWMWPVDWWAV